MFYYAEINSEYKVINKYCLTAESTNPNYILITEDLYTNGNELGDIVGQFYNSLSGVIEIVDPGWDMGQTCWMRYKDSQQRLSTKLDNMDKATSLKADISHTHEGYANSADLQALEDVVDTKANASHTHSEYASSTHSHTEYANVNHNHDSNYSPLSHSHTDYVTSTTFNALASEVDGKADASHTHSEYASSTHAHDNVYSPLSHTHTAAAIGAATSAHNHDSAYISKDLQMTSDSGDVSISWSGKDVVAQFKALTSGMYTAYSPVGCTNNPNATESFRFMCHKVGATTYGWVMAFGSSGSVYTGYVNAGTWQGWRAIWEYAPAPLWSGGSNGGYYMTAGHSVTPSKKLSECRNGWLLLWSDYDVGAQANNTDFATTLIPKRAYTGQMWSSAPFYCDIPSYQAGSATDSEQRVIKLLTISDTTITGAEYNATAPRNDVVLRAVYEW